MESGKEAQLLEGVGKYPVDVVQSRSTFIHLSTPTSPITHHPHPSPHPSPPITPPIHHSTHTLPPPVPPNQPPNYPSIHIGPSIAKKLDEELLKYRSNLVENGKAF